MNEEENPNPQPLVSVQRVVDLIPIAEKDRIELAAVNGYRAVVLKGSAKIGELIAFVEPDACVPVDAEHGGFLFREADAKAHPDGKRRARTRTKKIGGEWSRGLVVKLADLGIDPKSVKEGDDLTERLDVTKYEAGGPRETNGASVAADNPGKLPWPGSKLIGISRTDEVRLQSKPELIDELRNKAVIVTVKIDGSSITVARDLDGVVVVCSRNAQWLPVEGEALDPFNAIVAELGIADKLPPGYAIQGEFAGPGIQKNRAGFPSKRVLIFNVFERLHEDDPWSEMPAREARGFCADHGLTPVPVLQRGWIIDARHTIADFEALALTKYPNGFPAEGVVVRPEVPIARRNGSRLSFKLINPEFESRS